MYHRNEVLSGLGWLGSVRAAGIAIGLAILLIASGGPAVADNSGGLVNIDSGGFAIGRYDPVAYFTKQRAVRGKFGITARHKGAKYAFSSQAHKAMFVANPQKYAPQFGGFCAYGVFHGSKLTADPQLWEIVDGKLYFLINAGTKSIWTQHKSSYIQHGARAWKLITQPR